MTEARNFTAFAGTSRIASGPLVEVALAVKAAGEGDTSLQILTFDDATGRVVDLDLRGSAADIVARLAGYGIHDTASKPPPDRPDEGGPRGRGRPKLGVVAREVTLLPRHWEWLAQQPGGASQALRRLVDGARRADGGQGGRRTAREAAYRFMSAMAGDLPGFEEATRALFGSDIEGFEGRIALWPGDIADHARLLAAGALKQPME